MDRRLGVAVDAPNKEEGDRLTPLSIGSNVRSSAHSTGSRPNERPRSPEEVTSMDTRLKALEDEQNELRMKITQIQQMARECGATERTPDLWLGVLEIIHSDRATNFFMGSDPVGRMAIIKHYAKLHEDEDLGESPPHGIQSKTLLKRDEKTAEDSEKEWEEEFFNMFLDNNAARFSNRPNGTSYGEILGGREPFKPSSLQGKQVSSSRLSKRSRNT